MITHILHSSILALLLYGVYHLFLRKETFFQWNRAYLLAIPALSVLIPFLTAPFTIEMELGSITETISHTPVNVATPIFLSGKTAAIQTITPINYELVAMITYGIGVFISLLSFMYKVSTIQEIIRKGTTRFENGILITKTAQKLTAFSFFKSIVIDEQINDDKVQEIIIHELIHIKQFHSWDLVAYEICKVFFWFHPISYLAQRELKQIHEFIVDRLILKNEETTAYQESLLTTVLGTEGFTLTSSYFNKSLLKNRIIMLQKKKSSSKAFLKLAFIIPIVLGSLIFTACTQEVDVISESEIIEDHAMFLPRLSKFDFGKKDFFNGLSDDDVKFYYSFFDNFKNDSITMDNIDQIEKIIQSKEGKRYISMFSKISKNGKTLVVDDVNENFHIIYVTESPKREPSYETAPSEWNDDGIKSYVEGFLSGAFKDRVSELNDKQYIKMISQILKIKRESIIIEEIVKIEEIYPVSGEIDPHTEVIQDVSFAIIEDVPHFKECRGTNAELKKCTQEKISFLINKNFNTGLAKDLPGRHKIAVQFKIDKSGNVIGVQSKAKTTALQKEAARVINELPQMIPGKQRGEPVGTIYALPIIFEVQK